MAGPVDLGSQRYSKFSSLRLPARRIMSPSSCFLQKISWTSFPRSNPFRIFPHPVYFSQYCSLGRTNSSQIYCSSRCLLPLRSAFCVLRSEEWRALFPESRCLTFVYSFVYNGGGGFWISRATSPSLPFVFYSIVCSCQILLSPRVPDDIFAFGRLSLRITRSYFLGYTDCAVSL